MKRLLFIIVLLNLSCASERTTSIKNIDIQGHRGARGLYPENSIEGFCAALDMGVHTLEMDLCLSKDAVIIISHEPWMNANICLKANGDYIPKELQKEYNLYTMSKDAIQRYDCGSLGNLRFPQQKKIKTHKPTLEEAILASDSYAQKTNRKLPHYSLEIKRSKGFDGINHPDFPFFVQSVMHVIQQLGIEERTTLQCFDAQVLNYIHDQYANQEVSYLIGENQSIKEKLSDLTFQPNTISPHFSLLNKDSMFFLKSKDMTVITWTVNEVKDMKRMIALGIDGIITDYPNRMVELIKG